MHRSLVLLLLCVLCVGSACTTTTRPREASVPKACAGEIFPHDLARAKKIYPGSVTWSRDGSLLAAILGQPGEVGLHVDNADGIVVWSAKDGVVRERYRTRYVRAIAFAPNGTEIAFASEDGSGILDRSSGCARRWPIRGSLLAWGDGGGVLYISGSGGIHAVDPANGAILHERDATPPYVAMDLAGGTIALMDAMHGLHVTNADLSTWTTIEGRAHAIGNAHEVAIDPSGTLAAAGTVETRTLKYPPGSMSGDPEEVIPFTRLIALPSGKERERIPGDADALAFSPDGTLLAIAGEALVVRTIATKTSRVLDPKLYFAHDVAWSPDGRSLALSQWKNEGIAIYAVDQNTPPRLLLP